MSLIDPAVSLLYPVVGFIVVMTIVVFFHELGHFLVGRWCGVTIDAFSIGFGRELVAWVDRHGTRWRIGAVPLGGYVKFRGDMNAASVPSDETLMQMTPEERARTFAAQPVGRRAAIVAAGPIANFILAFVIFTLVFAVQGQPVLLARVGDVMPGGAGWLAGFKTGDLIRSIDGKPIDSFSDVQKVVSAASGETLRFEVVRDEHDIDLTATPRRPEVKGLNPPTIGMLDITPSQSDADIRYDRQSVADAMRDAAGASWLVVDRTATYVARLVVGREKADQLSGPIGVANVAGQVARIGISPLIKLIAVLSISIGLINLVPIPLLDGGHLLYYAFEALRGKPMSQGAQEFGFKIGLALVSMLMIFATYNDVLHLRG